MFDSISYFFVANMAIATPNSIAGYDYDPVDSLQDRLLCKICHLPSRDPYLSVCCGHLFCKSCLDNFKKAAAITNACPVCRDEEFLTFPNKAVDREIKSLRIYCTNKEKGCEWQGELNYIKNHLENDKGCQFEEVKCSNDCRKMIQRRYLASHVETECPHRKVNCQYCHDTGEHQFIEGQHKEECPKLPLPCPNKCEVQFIAREDMEKHRAACQLEVIDCSNDCGEKLERRCLISHIETECPRRKVNCQYCHKTDEHQVIEGQHKEECPKLPLPCSNKCEVGSVPREDMEAHRKECPLEMIQCEYYKTGCEVRMARKDQEKHKKENMEEHLMKTNLALADTKYKLADTTNQLAIALQRITTLEALVYLTTYQDKAAVGRPTSSAAVIESTLGWSVGLAAMAMMSKSGDQVCPVILNMSGYNELKKNNVIWYSSSFYTHDKGYKMCLKIHLNGKSAGLGTHLSCYLLLMKGPHDDNLSWPLKEKFRIKILNQSSDSQHHFITIPFDQNASASCTSRVTEGDRAKQGWGKPKFITHEDIHKLGVNGDGTIIHQFLKDDCLFFQISKV